MDDENLPYWRVSYKDRQTRGEMTLRWSCRVASEEAAVAAWAAEQLGDEVMSVERWPFDPQQAEWIPKGDGPKYPRNAVSVVSFVYEEGLLEFAPLGGGFCRKGSWERFVEAYRPVSDADLADARTPSLASFSLDFGPPILGFTWGQNWNGWGCPTFEKDSLIEWMSQMEEEDSTFCSVLYWKDGKLFYADEEHDIETTELEPTALSWEGRDLTVYDVSLGWCWWEEERPIAATDDELPLLGRHLHRIP